MDVGYNSKCMYDLLVGSADLVGLDDGIEKSFLNRLATKDQLLRRGIPILNSNFN